MNGTATELSAAGPSAPLRRGRVAAWVAVLLLVVGALAPLLANDVPLVARHDGRWSFPAFADLVGRPPPGPGDLTWKQWWSRLPAQGDDFAWMPPWPYGPLETEALRQRERPSLTHWCGCDDSGRDVLARLVHGIGTLVWLGLPAVLLAAVFGTLLGAWAGYRGGLVGIAVARAIDLFVCFPPFLFLLFAGAVLGSSSLAMVLVMAALFWTSFARVVRGELLGLRERDFVHVARGLGVGEWRILTRHLLPQLKGQIGIVASFCMASACIAESTLSFLGVGPSDTASSWGTMLRDGSAQAVLGAWHEWLFPTLAIVVVVVTCHALAERLREAPAIAD